MSTSSVVNVFSVPGFRFYPTEEELLEFYLQNKLENKREEEMQMVIPVSNVYQYDPWQIPGICSEEEEYFFFVPSQEKECKGGRATRTTPSGYWKATGSPTLIFSSSKNEALGVKRSMVFYQGNTNKGKKTKWKMNEYKAFQMKEQNQKDPKIRNEFSVCRVYTKSGFIRSFDRRPAYHRNPSTNTITTNHHDSQTLLTSNDDHDHDMLIMTTQLSNTNQHQIAGNENDDEDEDEVIKMIINSHDNEWYL